MNGEIDTAAIAVHELFMAYRRAGFNRKEAMELIKVHVAQAQRANGQ